MSPVAQLLIALQQAESEEEICKNLRKIIDLGEKDEISSEDQRQLLPAIIHLLNTSQDYSEPAMYAKRVAQTLTQTWRSEKPLATEDLFADILKQGVQHPKAEIRELILWIIHQDVERMEEKQIETVLNALNDSETRVYQSAWKIVLQMCCDPSLSSKWGNLISTHLSNLSNINRKSDAAVSLLSRSETSAHEIANRAKLKESLRITPDMVQQDPLTVAANLETVKSLCSSSEGLNILEEVGILKTVKTILEQGEDPLMVPYALDFIGDAWNSNASELDNSEYAKPIFNSVKWFLESEDSNINAAALGAVSLIAEKSTSFIRESFESEKSSTVYNIALGITSSVSHQRNITFRCLARMFSASSVNNHPPELLYSAYKAIQSHVTSSSRPTFMALLYYEARRENTEVQHSALQLINSLAHHSWGVSEIVECPGLINFLTNRDSSASSDTTRWKFAVVSSLSENPKLREIDSALSVRLRAFVYQGPFYARAEHGVDIGTEGGGI